jgi:hypothetical protein
MARIFISHSSHPDPFADQVLKAVKDGLGGQEIFIDSDVLRPGDEWCSVIYHRLAECHAAIILLNRAALESTWVRREVNILLWRRALGYPLEIVPALLGDVSVQDVQAAGFDELAPFQYAHIKDGARDLAAKITERFAGLPEPVPDESPMGEWINAIASQLGYVTSVKSLVAAAKQLQVETESLDRVQDPAQGCRFLAHQLLAPAPDRRVYFAVSKISDYLQTEWLSRLVDKVGPAWVDGEAARALLALGGRRPRIAILNARKTKTAECYVGRATCCAVAGYQHRIVTAAAGESFIDEFEQECRKAVRFLLKVPPGFDVEESLPEPGEEPEEMAFLVVDPDGTRMALVAEGIRRVQAIFPWLNVLLLAGGTAPTQAELASWQLADALVLSPPLKPKEELIALGMIMSLEDMVKTLAGSLAA